MLLLQEDAYMFSVFRIPQSPLPSHPYKIANREICAIIINSGTIILAMIVKTFMPGKV